MPRISYNCSSCDKTRKKFYKNAKEIKKTIECECGGELLRQLSSPSSKSTMVVDNGVQAKATELDREIVEIIEDREESSYKRRGDAVLENLK
tara:strand:+ start:21933 stop:22208 length:276 start_codon:yes stop_codon:yes gene_type:complete